MCLAASAVVGRGRVGGKDAMDMEAMLFRFSYCSYEREGSVKMEGIMGYGYGSPSRHLQLSLERDLCSLNKNENAE
jgi:hypothetical protein